MESFHSSSSWWLLSMDKFMFMSQLICVPFLSNPAPCTIRPVSVKSCQLLQPLQVPGHLPLLTCTQLPSYPPDTSLFGERFHDPPRINLMSFKCSHST
jgi:hypothetical protein